MKICEFLGSKFTFYNKNCNKYLHINKAKLEGVASIFTFLYVDNIINNNLIFLVTRNIKV
jgi:hypothetical protein